jgi:hypothetical protein
MIFIYSYQGHCICMLVVQGREDLHWKIDTLMQECEPIHEQQSSKKKWKAY